MAEVERDRALVRQSSDRTFTRCKNTNPELCAPSSMTVCFSRPWKVAMSTTTTCSSMDPQASHTSPNWPKRCSVTMHMRSPWSLDANDALEEWLQTNGWIVCEDEPQMILRPIPRVDLPATELTIEVVENERQYEDFMRVSETGRRWVPSLQAATDPQVALLVGSYQGQTIATSRLSCLGEIGNIHGVVTDPKFRRRGFGTAMTWAAIAEARKRGCTSIVLSASEMGYPVYRRMGFQTVCRFRIYVPAGTPV